MPRPRPRSLTIDNSPSCICPACGKSFARPDVLRKHLSTSCKLRRGSDGEAAPLTSAEEDAIIPRKRRRTKARAAVSPSPSSSSSSSVSAVSTDERERVRRVPASSSSASSASTKVATPVSPSSAVSPQSPADDRMSAHYARLRSLASFQAAGGRLSSSLPASSEGPTVARAGASLDTPLAPAFAATPETFGDLALGPLSSLPSFSLGLVSPKSTPATIAPSAVSASAAAPAQKEQPTWSTSANDDLLSWLFTVTNTVPPSAMPALSSSASSSGSVGSVDAWPVTPSESSRKLSDAGDLADLALLPDLPYDNSTGAMGLDSSVNSNGLGLGGLGPSSDFSLGGFSAIRGLPGMPEFGDKNGTDWLAHKSEKYDPYAYDQNTMAQMRVYYELYFKA